MTINFIQRYKVQGDCEITHTIIPDRNESEPSLKYGCKIYVPNNELDYFNKKCLECFKNRNIPITESFGKTSILIFDIDLNYNNYIYFKFKTIN